MTTGCIHLCCCAIVGDVLCPSSELVLSPLMLLSHPCCVVCMMADMLPCQHWLHLPALAVLQMSTHLLSAAQEVELTIHIKELLRCEKIYEEMREQLGRLPHDAEWAVACGASDVHTFISELTVCKDAKKQMIMCNQRLVMSMARKYVNRGMEMPDLIAEGIVGLVKAVERFDHTRGFKFSTYSHWWIRQAMNRAICEQGRIVRSDFLLQPPH